MRSIRAPGLQIATGIYALLYLYFVVSACIPSTRDNIISGNRTPPDSIELEVALVLVVFLVFVVGFTFSWWSQRIAGMILMFWFVLVLCNGYWSSVHGGDGMGALLAFPGLILGICFMVYAHTRRPNLGSRGAL